jgi:hypothetical protein
MENLTDLLKVDLTVVNKFVAYKLILRTTSAYAQPGGRF